MADLYCHCGAGPFDNGKALGGHRASHAKKEPCPGCGRPIAARAFAAHRRKCTGAPVVSKPALVQSLRDLVAPHLSATALERAAQLLDAHPDHRGVFVVVGETFGPYLTTRQNVGGLVARANEPCLVIDLDLLAPVAARADRMTYGVGIR